MDHKDLIHLKDMMVELFQRLKVLELLIVSMGIPPPAIQTPDQKISHKPEITQFTGEEVEETDSKKKRKQEQQESEEREHSSWVKVVSSRQRKPSGALHVLPYRTHRHRYRYR
jgi:hypothetical protein